MHVQVGAEDAQQKLKDAEAHLAAQEKGGTGDKALETAKAGAEARIFC